MEEKKTIAEDEIDLIELAKVIWSKRIFIAKVTGVFLIFGLIIAFTSKVEYEASCKLLPESQEGMKGNLGGLGGLAGLAGIDLNVGNSGVLTPELYPEIAKSLPFLLQIMEDTLFFENSNIKTTAFHYFKEIEKPSFFGYIAKYTIGLPRLVKSLFSDRSINTEMVAVKNAPIRISKEDWKLIENFKDRVAINVDSKSGLIDVSVEMPDPLAAADVTNHVVTLLTKEVTDYKIDKAKNNLDFVQASFQETKAEFEKTQLALAQMTDRNRNVSSALAEMEVQRLQNDYNVSFEVYKGLASQLEQAKIKLKEETPVFTVLEPVRIPEDYAKPKRGLILVVCVVMGFFLGIGYIILKSTIKN